MFTFHNLPEKHCRCLRRSQSSDVKRSIRLRNRTTIENANIADIWSRDAVRPYGYLLGSTRRRRTHVKSYFNIGTLHCSKRTFHTLLNIHKHKIIVFQIVVLMNGLPTLRILLHALYIDVPRQNLCLISVNNPSIRIIRSQKDVI